MYYYTVEWQSNCALRNPFRHDVYDEFGDATPIAQSECPEYIVEPYGFIVLVAQREAVDPPRESHDIASACLSHLGNNTIYCSDWQA
jgi:hypothetical protein